MPQMGDVTNTTAIGSVSLMSTSTPNSTLETPQGGALPNAPLDPEVIANEGVEAIAAALSAPTEPDVSDSGGEHDETHQDSLAPAEPVAADVSTGGGQPAATSDDRSTVLTAWKAKIGLTTEGEAPAGGEPTAPEPKAPTPPTPPKAPAKPAGDAPTGPIDLKATRAFFREEYGEAEAAAKIDPLLQVIEAQAARLESIDAYVKDRKEQERSAQQAQLEAYDREVNTFLDKEIVGKFPDADRILGTSDKADELHREARQVLHTKAVQIMTENIQARKVNPKLEPLAPQDALRKAAESLFGTSTAKPQTKPQARKEIESSITKRHNARTLVPTSAPAVGSGREEDPRQAGIDAIAAELARG